MNLLFYFNLTILFHILKFSGCWSDSYFLKKLENPIQKKNSLVEENLNEKPLKTSNSFNKPIFSYVGCFADRRESRDINEKEYTFITKFNKTMPTVELCVNLCAQDGYSVAGVQAFDECFCGNSYGKYNATDDSNCFFKCAGKYTCGGYNANSVYFISSNSIENDRSIVSTSISTPCASSPCLNSGMCITLMDDKGIPRGFICRCKNPQDTGVYCEERNFCHSNPCLNAGICENTMTGFVCKCPNGWTGFNCNTPTYLAGSSFNCFEEVNHCRNGGTCFKLMDLSYMCRCPPNYRGTYCQVFDMCSTLPCLNGGTCNFMETDGFHCNCSKNFYGKKCEFKNTCLDSMCFNGGQCQIDQFTHKKYCSCPDNFSGTYCQECKPQFIGEKCDQCAKGYTGHNCEFTINVCSPNPCLNGVCSVDGSSYKCICSEGWRGKNCTEKNCLIKSCLNEGVCTSKYDSVNQVMDFRCECPSNYYGDQCELLNLNPCHSNPCSKDEECILQQDNSFMCVKSLDFCERIKPCNNYSECIYSKDNNTFFCKCLNGKENCDDSDFKIKNLNATIPVYNMEPKMTKSESSNSVKIVQEKNRVQPNLSKLKFKSDNLYLILPIGLVAFVVIASGIVAGYFGFRSKRRKADFENDKSEIRTINYMNDNSAFNDTLNNPISNSSINGYPTVDKSFNENYGRV